MYKLVSCIVVVSLAAAFVSSTHGDDGWTGSSLNPFARKAGPPTSARVSDSPTGGWKMPSLWPAKRPATAAAIRKPAQPSAWQKMTASSKKFWSGAADMINPFDDASDKPQQPISATGANSVFTQAANRKPAKPKSNSFFPWTSGDNKEPVREKKGDVNGFLSQPRPGF